MKLYNVKDERFKELNERYRAISGEQMPLEMMPHESYDTLEKNIKRCEDAGKDLFPEIYGWQDDLIY